MKLDRDTEGDREALAKGNLVSIFEMNQKWN